MGPKEAVAVAKQHVFDLFADEGIDRVGLEEIEKRGSCWEVTIGFTRPWDQSIGIVLSGSSGRAFKVLLVSEENGAVLSVKDRNLPKSII